MIKVFIFVLALLVPVMAFGKEVHLISANGVTFKVGALFDDMVPGMKKLMKYRRDYKVTYSDPSNPNLADIESSTAVYDVKGKKFTVTFARTTKPGPFKVTHINAQ